MSATVTNTPLAGRFAVVRWLARAWWLFLLRGSIGLACGLLALLFPLLGLQVNLVLLAAWMAVDGGATLLHAATHRREAGAMIWLDGVVSLLAAGALVFRPGDSALALVLIAGVWLTAAGIVRLVLSFQAGNLLLAAFGALTVLLGGWILVHPGAGLLALIWALGVQALLSGLLLLGIGWRLRRVANDPNGPPG
jgi:uncharacterized membrane protein HdeD (DUF308 family)